MWELVGSQIFTEIAQGVAKMVYYQETIMILTIKMYLDKYKANLEVTQLPQSYAGNCTA